MSKATQGHFEFARAITPDVTRTEPAVWFQELRLLHKLSLEGDDEIRRISLHRGLNILWSPPEDPEATTQLYREGWGGHAAGKTLFCRILRHLLGEPNFATKSLTESIQGEFPQAWAVARLRVDSESWIVGRPLTGPGQDFAVRAEQFEAVLQTSVPVGGFDVFRAKLESIVREPLNDLYPVEAWRHTLPWLARDQECRYARITTWRDTLSEADSPKMSVARQHAVMRALLGLLDPKENTAQSNCDSLAEEQRKLEPKIQRQSAMEERERSLLLSAILRVLPDGLNLDDLEAAQRHLTSHREVRRERLEKIESEPESLELRQARQAFEDARADFIREKASVTHHQKRANEIRSQADEMMASVERIRSAGISDPKLAAANWCPHTLEFARERGCVDGVQSPDQPTAFALNELEAKANKLFAEADQATAQQAQSESQLEHLEAIAVNKTNQYASLSATTRNDAINLQRDLARLEECENRLDAYEQTATELARQNSESEEIAGNIEKYGKDAKRLRESIDKLRIQFVAIYADIIQAVIGASVTAEIKIDGDGVHLQATRQGELSGAALETVKTLAFDIAGVVSSIEGRCAHPRFLIHDGPREADMDRVIYEHFFIYAVERMEATFADPNKISFQYILTTTTPPPQQMQEGSAWLKAKLSSHSKGERLLKANL